MMPMCLFLLQTAKVTKTEINYYLFRSVPPFHNASYYKLPFITFFFYYSIVTSTEQSVFCPSPSCNKTIFRISLLIIGSVK